MNKHQEKIYNYLLERISSGEFVENKRIPTENELGEIFSTNRMNAHSAVKELERFGILFRNKKRGTFVKRVPSRYSMGQLKCNVLRRVCILNMAASRIQHIHFNDKILTPLESHLHTKNISIYHKDIKGVKTVEEYKKFLSEQVDYGCNALVLIADGSGEGVVFDYPELLSDFHKNVFVYDPGQSIWQNMPYNVVTVNLFGEGILAADHLHSQGYRNLVFCQRAGTDRVWLNERLKGIECSIRRHGLDCIPKTVLFGPDISQKTFYHELKETAKNKKTALIVMNDELAAQIIDEAAAAGISFGEEIGLVSFDDNSMFRSYDISTVAPSLDKIGEELAGLIIDNIDNELNDKVVCVKVESKLIIRRT